MENPKKELIEEVVDLFEDYQEDYVPGEWEAFSKSQKKRAFVIPLWMKIAAVLIVMITVVPLVWRSYVAQEQMAVVHQPVMTEHRYNKIGSDSAVAAKPADKRVEGDMAGEKIKVERFARNSARSFAGKKELITKNGANGYAAAVNGNAVAGSNNPVVVSDYVAAANGNAAAASSSPVIVSGNVAAANGNAAAGNNPVGVSGNLIAANNNPVTTSHQITDKAMKADNANDKFAKAVAADTVRSGKLSTIDFLLAESKQPVKKTKKKDTESKWDFGVEVAPAATRANVNVGGGLTTAYRLSDKFSLSTGISLLQLDADRKDPSAGKYGVMNSPVPSYDSSTGNNYLGDGSDRQLLGVNANIKAIDIPISVIYKFDQRYYTSIGVSYFNVIGEKRNNTFMQTSRINEDRVNPATGQFYTKLISTEVEEQGKETPLRGNSYLGFFNFSLGRRQNLFNKYNILIEPFIKVPIGKLSDEDLRLTNSGIKFQVSF